MCFVCVLFEVVVVACAAGRSVTCRHDAGLTLDYSPTNVPLPRVNLKQNTTYIHTPTHNNIHTIYNIYSLMMFTCRGFLYIGLHHRVGMGQTGKRGEE